MLKIPLDNGKTLSGSEDQLHRLALYLQRHVAQAASLQRRANVQLWDDQVVSGTYADLGILAERLATLTSPPARARYTAIPTAYAYAPGAIPFTFPDQREPITQTLNARGNTGGLRLPGPDEAQPANPGVLHLSQVGQPYLAQICHTDLQSRWGWTPQDPVYEVQAGHILVAAVLITLQHQLLLTEDQILAIRWQRSPQWDCYLPAALLNSWSLLVAHHLGANQPPAEHETIRLSI